MIGHADFLARRRAQVRYVAEDVADCPAILPFALGGLAWLVILANDLSPAPWRICTASTWGQITVSAVSSTVAHQILMLVAMMTPLIAGPVEHVVARSYQARQVRGAIIFILGYLVVWSAAAIMVMPIIILVRAYGAHAIKIGATAGLVMAAVWQVVPAKRTALRRCSRTAPLRQDGWRADLACARYGADITRDCLVACWALMLAPLIVPENLGSMVLVQSIAIVERVRPQPDLAASALALVFWAGVMLLT